MKERIVWIIVSLVILCSLAQRLVAEEQGTKEVSDQTGPSAGQLCQQAFFQESGNGDLKAAIKKYQEVVDKHAENASYAAKALLRMGPCYEELGKEAEAQKVFRKILSKFPDRDAVVAEALKNLDGMKEIRNSLGMEFLLIPAGEFTMGRRGDQSSEHRVRLTKRFCVSKYEVTQQQWFAVMGYNPSRFEEDTLPVEMVSCSDSTNTCLVGCLPNSTGLKTILGAWSRKIFDPSSKAR